MDEAVLKELPDLPYKGLSFYDPGDEPLFAGRVTAVKECASLIKLDSTRILLLHGNTACGKSSFLRAGLIPHLRSSFFQLETRIEEGRRQEWFVTSSYAPLRQLASFIYDLAAADREIETGEGTLALGLPAILLKDGAVADRNEFVKTSGESAEIMLDLLARLAARLAQRLIIVIDQAEEVLTLLPGSEGDKDRDEFFKFIDLFAKRQFPIKLVAALRTEYFGRFLARIRQYFNDPVLSRDYYLTELTEAQIVEAIKEPTLDKPPPGYALSAAKKYKFSFEKNLPERIAKELKRRFSAGGALPVMQIVCANLYKSVPSRKGRALIRTADYEAGGRLEGQIAKYVDDTLKAMCNSGGFAGEPESSQEVDRWKEVLAELVSSEPDGSVTTKVLPRERMKKHAEKLGCLVPFEVGSKLLASAASRILRDRTVYTIDTGARIDCYSLGHDAIGLVLRRWRALREEAMEAQKARRVFLMLRAFLATIGLLMIAGGPAYGLFTQWNKIWIVISAEGLVISTFALLTGPAQLERISIIYLSLVPKTLLDPDQLTSPILRRLLESARR